MRRKRTATCPMQVYFVTCGPYIKIGISKDPRERLRTMKTGNPYPLELIGYIEGDECLESTLHNMFQKDHVRGEWFLYTAACKEYLSDLCTQGVVQRDKRLSDAIALLGPVS